MNNANPKISVIDKFNFRIFSELTNILIMYGFVSTEISTSAFLAVVLLKCEYPVIIRIGTPIVTKIMT